MEDIGGTIYCVPEHAYRGYANVHTNKRIRLDYPHESVPRGQRALFVEECSERSTV